MFTRSYLVWVAAAVLLSACSGEIAGISGDESGTGDLVATVSVNNGWHSIEASEPAFETLEFEVLARPLSRRMSAGITLGGPEVAELGDGPIKVRFAEDGFIDAYNDGVWDKQATVEYRTKAWYRIAIYADLVARTYDVEVEQYKGPPRKRLVAVIKGAPLDLEAAGAESLTNWAAWSSGGELELTEASWVASGSCAPLTCESWGVDCGEPGDGCGGTLSCGSCATGQTCDAGVCVDACAPSTCESLGAECGLLGDGCGGTLSCGSCATGQACDAGACVDWCAPETCASLGVECGNASDGCGGTLSCGSCGVGQTCSSGSCVASSPPPPGTHWWDIHEKPDATNTGPNPSSCPWGVACPNTPLTNIGSCPTIDAGYAAGLPLKNWYGTDYRTLENFECSGALRVETSGVAIRNFIVNANTSAFALRFAGNNVSNNLVEFGHIKPGGGCDANLRGRGWTGRYLHAHGCGDVMKIGDDPGTSGTTGPLVLEHSLFYDALGGHGDIFQVWRDLDSEVTIRHSSITCSPTTSCLITTGVVGDTITFDENWVYGNNVSHAFRCRWESGDAGPAAIFVTNNLMDREPRNWTDGYPDCFMCNNRFMDDFSHMPFPLNEEGTVCQ